MPPYDTLSPYQPVPVDLSVRSVCAYDTLFTPTDHLEPVPRKSLFTHHLLPVRHGNEIVVHHSGTPGWCFGGVVLSVLFMVLFLRRKQLRVPDILQSLFSERTMERALREANLTRATSQAVIAPVVLLPLCLAASQLSTLPHSGLDPESQFSIFNFLLLYAISLVAYYIRNGIVRFIGNAFLNSEAVHIYLTSNYIYHLTYGLAATLLVFFICFTGSLGILFSRILAGIVLILFVMRIIRGMQLILTHSKTPKLFLFYYLCTLEIAPPIVLIFAATS